MSPFPKFITLSVACSLLSHVSVAQEDLSVLSYWNYHKSQPHAIYSELMQIATKQLEERKMQVTNLKTSQQWKTKQSSIKINLKQFIGDFPAKTPLNPVLTGTLEKNGVLVEKVLFESLPGYYVTAAVFKPKNNTEKLPTIIFCSGHSANGFRSDTYQTMILNYVKKGFLVLAFDPIGQGERIQYKKEDNSPRFGPTHEHSYPGTQAILKGISPAKYFIWDGIRAVDYLLTRSDVDSKRIGITGRSGGGTQSAYIAAVDDRILAAAPECYLTSFDKLLRSKGPQDAEQIFINGLKNGFDLADLVTVRAPKPTLMVTTRNDIFSIAGAREVFSEASEAYSALGAKEAVQMIEDDAGHASTKLNREGTYAFFQKYLNNPGSSEDLDVEIFNENELWVTPTGNIYDSKPSKKLYDVVAESKVTPINKVNVTKSIIERVHGKLEQPLAKEVIYSGRAVRSNYHIEKYLIQTPSARYIPILYLKPNATSKGTILLVSDQGKAEVAKNNALADQLCKKGYEVIVPDVIGYGEVKDIAISGGDALIEGVSLNLWYLAAMTGKSLSSIRMQDISLVGEWAKKQGNNLLQLVADGSLVIDALQVSVAYPNLFHRRIYLNGLSSIQSLLSDNEYRTKFIYSTMPGVLNSYDVNDLVNSSLPNQSMWVNAVNGKGEVEEKSMFPKTVKQATAVSENEVATTIFNFLK